ncbi:MAG: trypsin-like peptidase domain-containing protein [Pirellulales bacterium]|nr:trypsin-like peptidase domain-containing protein [Pirellulales bacterium]
MGNFNVRVFLSILMVLGVTATAPARPTSTPPKHPAVVRVVVPEGSSMSLGSGALVAVNKDYGLVVTNWHVVRDGNGTATVIFPDGFQSGATVVRVDRDWDLAALVIWRPRVRPIPLAGSRPDIGDPLWIAGYGKGSYRIAAGRCTHYVSPGGRLPFDMIELSAGARQGDSGGPILNQQGELAGVLFGAAWGKTSGSHCLRVKQFLDPVLNRFDLPADDPTMIARREAAPRRTPTPTRTPTVTIASGERSNGWSSSHDGSRASNAPPRVSRDSTSGGPSSTASSTGRETPRPWTASSPAGSVFPVPVEAAPVDSGASTRLPLSNDPWEQGKTVLAIVGLLAVCFHVLRWLGT